MRDHSVSVIIPTYNNALTLSTCIDSALYQNLVPHKIIVINDGSTDNTAEVVKTYGNKIKYIEQSNQGQGAARNAGLKKASGRFIAFLDADDYWVPEFLEKCVDFLLKHEEAVAVSTGLIIKMFNGVEYIRPSFLKHKKKTQEAIVIQNFLKFWADHDHVRTGSNVIRRDIIEKAGYQRSDLRISQDLEYWGYIATFGKWGFIPEPLWVGNSRSVVKQGWIDKYRKRRYLCPTVEAWEKRIVPRLKKSDMHYFEIVRGRVAAGYAHNQILAGKYMEAYQLVCKYGSSMPRNRLTMLMLTAIKLGLLGWLLACLIIRLKEILKAWRLRYL